MRHARASLRLLAKAALKAWVVRQIGLEQLDCDGAAEAGINTLVNLGHATAANQGTESVPAGNQSLLLTQNLLFLPRLSLVLPSRIIRFDRWFHR
jgi:hypothetical protein